ncbi:hypothetical protein EVAR_10877_1 [Eumeta japonica]|uniref:Uncharacterized protein n=1 Tax=Eumeta variegata TaxID=151549 RepID=A0A4C1URH4_EUMVA|nr:hypothetical protein EVAR_10877_1 [Eumeta japonica]
MLKQVIIQQSGLELAFLASQEEGVLRDYLYSPMTVSLARQHSVRTPSTDNNLTASSDISHRVTSCVAQQITATRCRETITTHTATAYSTDLNCHSAGPTSARPTDRVTVNSPPDRNSSYPTIPARIRTSLEYIGVANTLK